jgi:hypothetical protein
MDRVFGITGAQQPLAEIVDLAAIWPVFVVSWKRLVVDRGQLDPYCMTI